MYIAKGMMPQDNYILYNITELDGEILDEAMENYRAEYDICPEKNETYKEFSERLYEQIKADDTALFMSSGELFWFDGYKLLKVMSLS